MVEGRKMPLRTVEHRRPRTPEPQPCREEQRDPMKCRRAAVEGTGKATEDVIGRLQREDGDGGCHEGAARRSTGSRKRHRASPQRQQAALPVKRVAEDRTGHPHPKGERQVRRDNFRGGRAVLRAARGDRLWRWRRRRTGSHARDDCGGPGGDVPRPQDLKDWQPPRRRRRRRPVGIKESRDCRFVSVGTTLHGGGGLCRGCGCLLEMKGSRRQSPLHLGGPRFSPSVSEGGCGVRGATGTFRNVQVSDICI